MLLVPSWVLTAAREGRLKNRMVIFPLRAFLTGALVPGFSVLGFTISGGRLRTVTLTPRRPIPCYSPN